MTTIEQPISSSAARTPSVRAFEDARPWQVALLAVAVAVALAARWPGDQETFRTFVVTAQLACPALFALGLACSSPATKRLAWTRRPEALLAVGLLGLIIGSPVVPATVSTVAHDVPQGLGLLSAAAGLLGLLHERVRSRAWHLATESGVQAALAGLVTWALVALPALSRRPELASTAVAGTIVVASLHLLVALLAVRLLQVSSGRPAAHLTLAAAVATLLVGHLVTLRATLGGGAPPDGAVALLGLLGLGLWGSSALHPSMGALAESVASAPTRIGASRVALLTVAVLAGPALLVASPPPSEGGAVSIAVGAGVVSLLALGHLVRLVHEWGRLEHQVGHDDLTGLPGRALFDAQVGLALEHSHRSASPLAVMFLDLDRFKVINDNLGHAAGNSLLQQVARRLRSTLGPPAVVARLSGDEFAVLLPDLTSRSDSERNAAAVLDAFSRPFSLGERTVYVSLSIGIAHSPTDGTEAATLLRNADAAMYRAKDRGRNTYALYTADLHATVGSRLSLEAELHTALEKHQLVLYYQPKVNLEKEDICGAEALIRWQHPTLGLLGPDEFIPLAEETGMIGPIGEWVLEEACRQAKAWQDASYPHLTVAVNVSARQFALDSVESLVARVLRRTGLSPDRLELELTETLAFQQPELISATLADLKAMGVRTSIDDFGTGYSGLSYLDRFPVDAIKIDKSFVKAIDGRSNPSIVLAVIALAKGLGLDVVAEGVETDEQLTFLRHQGVTHMQGFLFSAPVPAERFETLLMLESIAAGPGRLTVVPSGLPINPFRRSAAERAAATA